MKIDDYYDGSDVLTADHGGEDYFRISPSGASKFFSQTTQWYRENLMGEKGFQGSTATILGTIVHFFAECAATGEAPANADKVVAEYLNKQKIEYDRADVELHWRDMANVLNEEAVFPVQSKIHSTEQFIHYKVTDGIYVAGTYDALLDNKNGTYTIRDYKTAAKKPSSFSYDYKVQSLIYAWVMRKQGVNVTEIELQYVVKPTKTLPVRNVEFKYQVTEEDMNFIDNVINIIAKSVKCWKEQPEMRPLLAQDIRIGQEKPQMKSIFKTL